MKKGIIGFVLGTLLFGSIGVYATSKYVSKDISYTKQDGTTTNVENALNDLYNNRINENSFTNVFSNYSSGGRTVGRTTSVELSKGKYIISVVEVEGSSGGGSNTSSAANRNVNIDCNDCQYKYLSNLGSFSSATTKASNTYAKNNIYTTMYYVEVNSDDTIAAQSLCAQTTTTYAHAVIINAVKID